MKELVMFCFGALLASGWWSIGVWGLPESGVMMLVAVPTIISSIIAAMALGFIIYDAWDK